MKKRIYYTSVVLAVVGVFVACNKGNSYGDNSIPPSANSCGSVAAKFAANVNPIIQSSCATSSGCHGTGSTNGPGALTTYNEIKSAASQIRSAVVGKRMPLNSSLTDAQIQTISCWVDNGALND